MTDPNMLSLAVIRFLGHGTEAYPKASSARLIDEFGAEMASRLESEVRAILDELNSLKPDWPVHSSAAAIARAKEDVLRRHPEYGEKQLNVLNWPLNSACIWAKEEMRRRHPELSEDALNALDWAFSFGWR